MLILSRCYFMYFHAYTRCVKHVYLQIHFNTDGIIGWNYSATVSCHFLVVRPIWHGTFQSTSLSLTASQTPISWVNDNAWNIRHFPLVPGSPQAPPEPHLPRMHLLTLPSHIHLPFHLMLRLPWSKAFRLFLTYSPPPFQHLLFMFFHWVV